MNFRRVLLLTVLGLTVCTLTASASPSVRASAVEGGEQAEPKSQATETTISLIRGVIVNSKALAQLASYRSISAGSVRFLVVIDRKNERDEDGRVVRFAKDLLSTADGRLWILDRHRVRPLTSRDLTTYGFSLAEAQLGLDTSNRRPVSIVLPKRLVTPR